MRKTMIASNGYAPATGQVPSQQSWLDLASLARVELTSEDADFPVEQVFADQAKLTGEAKGWQAAEPGPQTLRLCFNEPQTIKRVQLSFRERERERMQEFTLDARLLNGSTREIVRQQWNFSPNGSTDQHESHLVNLADVVILTLWIDPDRGQNRYPATLQTFRVEG